MRTVVLCAVLAVVGCDKKAADTPDAGAAQGAPAAAPASTIETTTFDPSLGVDLATMTKMPNGLYYKDLVVGTGTLAEVGKSVTAKYAGMFPDAKGFDQGEYTFPAGGGQVIRGWDEGIPGMRVGGKRLLVIPSELGYGANGSGPIPPNAVLVFNVEVLDVK